MEDVALMQTATHEHSSVGPSASDVGTLASVSWPAIQGLFMLEPGTANPRSKAVTVP